MTDRVGCGIFIKDPDIKVSYRLPGHCSIFKSRGHGDLKAVQCLLSGGIFLKNLQIYSDSQAAIKSLTNIVSMSVLVHEC